MSINTWFTADTHLGHGRIIEYTNRPFRDAAGRPDPQRMNAAILDRFNSVLRRGDVLYHLGDVSWSSYNKQTGFIDRLNTKEIHLVWGNHDHPKDFKQLPFRSFADIKSITAAGQRFVLCHYPMRSWRGKGNGTMQLYGHCHNSLPGLGRQMDVGVDTNDFYPWHVEDVIKKLKDVPFYPEEGKDD